ncbi:MAG: N-acetyltransferase family protein [Halanaeroarchaeum sp.]
MEIEPATLEDLDALVEGWLALAREQRDHGSHLRAEPNRGTMRESLARSVVDDNVLVARDDGAVIGFVTVEMERGRLEETATRGVVPYLFVVPDRRDGGIGAELLDAAERRLLERGADVVSLDVMADNGAARRFYRQRGYDAHRVTMEKRISTENDTHSKDDR